MLIHEEKCLKPRNLKRPRLKEFIQSESDEYHYYDEDSSEEYVEGEAETVTVREITKK